MQNPNLKYGNQSFIRHANKWISMYLFLVYIIISLQIKSTKVKLLNRHKNNLKFLKRNWIGYKFFYISNKLGTL